MAINSFPQHFRSHQNTILELEGQTLKGSDPIFSSCGILSVMKFPNLKFEKELWHKGFKYVCGLDEVGRGSWAGPVVAAAVIFPHQKGLTLWRLLRRHKIRDSKQLAPKQRKLRQVIRENCLVIQSVKPVSKQSTVKVSLKRSTDF